MSATIAPENAAPVRIDHDIVGIAYETEIPASPQSAISAEARRKACRERNPAVVGSSSPDSAHTFRTPRPRTQSTPSMADSSDMIQGIDHPALCVATAVNRARYANAKRARCLFAGCHACTNSSAPQMIPAMIATFLKQAARTSQVTAVTNSRKMLAHRHSGAVCQCLREPVSNHVCRSITHPGHRSRPAVATHASSGSSTLCGHSRTCSTNVCTPAPAITNAVIAAVNSRRSREVTSCSPNNAVSASPTGNSAFACVSDVPSISTLMPIASCRSGVEKSASPRRFSAAEAHVRPASNGRYVSP